MTGNPFGDIFDLPANERAKVLKDRLNATKKQPAPEPEPTEDYSDLVPQAEEPVKGKNPQLDAVIAGIDIVDAYRRLCGKSNPEPGNKTEGIKVSCPMPDHADRNPSAWLNSNNNTWYCGACQLGGDVMTLAAIHFGYGMTEYQNKDIFPYLREQLANYYGYTVVKGVKDTYVVPVSEPASPIEVPEPVVLAPIVTLVTQEDPSDIVHEEYEDYEDLFVDWESLLDYDGFLRQWMVATTVDDLPHEFYLWLGLQALGFCGANITTLRDFQPVKPNLYLCLYGKTGLGKSRSMRPYLSLIDRVFPFAGDIYSKPSGVRILPTPGSAEAIIDSFRWDVQDSTTQKVVSHESITGLLRHEELSGLISKAQRHGSSIKEVLIEMYDVFGEDVSTHSRTSGISRARSPFCQMVSTTQPNAIHAFLRRTDVESGFLNRWIFAAGTPRIDPISYGGVVQDISKAVDSLDKVKMWAALPHEFVLVGDALKVWHDFFTEEIAPYKSGAIDQESILSRVDLVIKKLIILFTLDAMEDQPTVETVTRAISLWKYLRCSYKMFSRDIIFNDLTECQNAILAAIEQIKKRTGLFPTKRDLSRAVGKKFDTDTVIRAMRNMVDLGILDELAPAQQVGVRGRPSTRYKLAEE